MPNHSPSITGTTADRISVIVSLWKGVINEAHSASYGIIIKVRKQPHRGFEIKSNLLAHRLRSELVKSHPTRAHGYLLPVLFVSYHTMISFLNIPQTLAIYKG